MESLLVHLFGFPATLIHSDTTVWDRWRWLKARLPNPTPSGALLEVGCGTGAFTIGAARLGYRATGLSWDLRNQEVAAKRAAICGIDKADFIVGDARKLNEEGNLTGKFDVVVCLECIEHILDDGKLMKDLAACLKQHGRLFLTTPNVNYRPLTANDNGPWSVVEDGGHVRKGYGPEDIRGLCGMAGLEVEKISYCTGVLSQKITALWRVCSRVNPIMAWLIILPLRILPPLLDRVVTSWFKWPEYSICLEASKGSPAEGVGRRSGGQ